MIRASLLALALLLSPLAVGALATGTARADDVTEASALFESGNGHFQAGMRARGARRARELEAALDDYFASLRLVRSRNVLYNTALVLEQLERWDDAFNYWSEYLAVTGLSADETTDGTTHRDALRPRVAVARITSTPAGASVWVDRRDLASRGTTPLELAIPAGEHRLWLVRSGWGETEGAITVTVGATADVTLTMIAAPVTVQVLAPDARLTLDGEPITAGSSIAVAPGPHRLTLELDGRPAIERRFEVVPGGAPMVIDLTSAVASLGSVPTEGASFEVVASAPSRVLVDGLLVGSGTRLGVPVEEGEHEITVEPAGAPTWRGRRSFGVGDGATLRIASHPTSGGILALRAIGGVGAILGLLGAGGLSIGAALAHDDYREMPTQDALDRVNAFNLAADVSWGITAALGTLAIIALAIDDAGTDGRFEEPTGEGESE